MTTTSRDIERLIVQAKGGDDSALGQVLTSFATYLNLMARMKWDRRLQGKVSPSDVVQETMLAATGAFAFFRGSNEREMMAWLRSILASKLAERIRYFNRDKRAVRYEIRLNEDLGRSSVGLLKGVVDPGNSPSEQVAQREAEVLVADALASLADDHREVIIRRSLQHMSFAEVANHMGRSIPAVKSLWVRALANLRRAVARNEEDVDRED